MPSRGITNLVPAGFFGVGTPVEAMVAALFAAAGKRLSPRYVGQLARTLATEYLGLIVDEQGDYRDREGRCVVIQGRTLTERQAGASFDNRQPLVRFLERGPQCRLN